MKKRILLAGLSLCTLAMATTITSCRKTIDCAIEGAFTSITATEDDNNVKEYTFKPNYYGDHTVNTVEWDFGDGQQATTNGTETVTHVYSSAGTKKVTARINIKYKSMTCSAKPEKSIDVQ
ncbi:PKD domain-containing protein [Edaphocola aurantiacus]|uniref:PKD domain-containing protein n=1 Tax=Edaphocola aurantiacus TaxID=2601682 RepID=UPI001C93F23F|nr:PKD domain-containing protein [Edaphocola aurantiacus]